MKKLLIILFITVFQVTQAQEIKHSELDLSCEAGIVEARQDIEAGKFKLLSYGLILHKDFEFHKFYIRYVAEKYGVILGDGGCVVSEKTICYSETMEKAILEKFGQDFFNRTESEAKEAYIPSE